MNINKGQEISLRLRTDDLKGGRGRGAGGGWVGGFLPAGPPCYLLAQLLRCRRCPHAHPTPGFRRYDRIRETLLHELAHMVGGWVGG